MQPCGGRGGRSRLPGVYRLIALPILKAGVDIGRQGHDAHLVQRLLKDALIGKRHMPYALIQMLQDARPEDVYKRQILPII